MGPDTVICSGDTITLNPGASYTDYLWSNESTNNSLLVFSTGTYCITATDEYNCKIIDSISVEVDEIPVADFSYSIDMADVTFINNSQNASSFYWDFGDSSFSTDINPVHTYASAADYVVLLKALNENCGDSSLSKSIKITDLLVDNINYINSVKIFPNPSNGFITIAINKDYQAELAVEITNISGKKVYNSSINTNQNINKIDLSYLSSGIYYLKLTSKDFTVTTKLILN